MSSTLSKSLIRLHRCHNAITHRSLQASKSLTTQSGYTCVSNSTTNGCTTNYNHNGNASANANANVSIRKYSPIPQFQIAQFSTKPNVEEDPSAAVTADPNANADPDAKRSPSVLSNLPQNYTPGQAWGVLQKHLAGHNKVRLDDFISLCNASRPQYPKDAKVILTALLDLKRCNDFYISEEGARAAIDAMVRSMISDSGLDATEAGFQLKAGIYVANVFGNEDAGLYVVAGTQVLNDFVFKILLSGAEHYSSTPRIHVDADANVDDVDADAKVDADANAEDGESSESDSLLAQAATVAKGTVDILLTRASTPTKDMKKRKKRKYLKHLRCSSGPTPETIDLAVKICLKHDDEEKGVEMARAILDSYKECPHIGSAEAGTIALVQDAENRLQTMKDTEAADDEGEVDGDGDDDDSEAK